MELRLQKTTVENVLNDLEHTWHRIDSDMSIKMQEALSILKDIMGHYFLEKAVVAWDDGNLVGIAVYTIMNGRDLGIRDIHITNLASFTPIMGVGMRLIQEIVDIAKEGGYGAITANHAPGYKGFYIRMGFVEDERYHETANSMIRILKPKTTLDLDELLAPNWKVEERTTLSTPQFAIRVGSAIPRYVYHVPEGKADFGKVVKAYQIREIEAADSFGHGYKNERYVWLSLTAALGKNNTYIIDMSKLDNESLRFTGQVEGHLLHMGDIPAEAVVAIMRNGQILAKPT